MNKAIFCFVILFFSGCKTTDMETVRLSTHTVYDCTIVSKRTLIDFVSQCAGNPPTLDASNSAEYNSRVTNCTKRARELFCQPLQPATKPTATP